MANPSDINVGIQDISKAIKQERASIKASFTAIVAARQNLQGLPGSFSDVVTTIQGFDPGTTDPFEQAAIADLNSLTTEFQALVADALAAEAALAGV